MFQVAYFYRGKNQKIFKTVFGLTRRSVSIKAAAYFDYCYNSGMRDMHMGFTNLFYYIFWRIKIAIIPEEIDDDESIIEIEDENEIPD